MECSKCGKESSEALCGYCKKTYCDSCLIEHFRWCPFCKEYTCVNCFSWDNENSHIKCQNCDKHKNDKL